MNTTSALPSGKKLIVVPSSSVLATGDGSARAALDLVLTTIELLPLSYVRLCCEVSAAYFLAARPSFSLTCERIRLCAGLPAADIKAVRCSTRVSKTPLLCVWCETSSPRMEIL